MRLGSVLLVSILACGEGNRGAPPRASETLSLATTNRDGIVVAEVNETKIYDTDVATLAKEKQTTAAKALDELISAELLAAEALRRGHGQDPEVLEARKREGVRQIVRSQFGKQFDGPEDIPEEEVERVWKRSDLHAYFDHEEVHEVYYVRAVVNEGASEAENQEAKILAQELHDTLVRERPKTFEDFASRAQEIASTRGGRLKGQKLSTMRHGNTVEPFAAAAFSLSTIGQISTPTRTRWGWDVLMLLGTTSARHASRQEADKEIRAQIFDGSRRTGFQRWADSLVAKRHVVRHDELLERVDVVSPAGVP